MAKFKMHMSGMSLSRAYHNTTYTMKDSGAETSDRDTTSTTTTSGISKLKRQLMTDLSIFESEVLYIDNQHNGIIDQDSKDEHPPVKHGNDSESQQLGSHPGTSTSDKAPSSQEPAQSSSQGNFGNLPAVVLCLIFSYLKLRDLCCMSRVCRQWHEAAKDPRLWKIIQQTPTDSDELMMFFKSFMGKSLIFLRPFSLSKAALQHINQNCCNLQALWLVDIDVTSLDLDLIPSSLVSLAIVPTSGTSYPSGEWWKALKKFEGLDFLFISKSQASDEVLQVISKLTTLTGLRFEECLGEISEETFSKLTQSLSNLTFLSLTSCSGVKLDYLQYISRNLKALHQLRLNRAWTLNARRDLVCLQSLPELKILHIQNGTDSNTVQVQEFSDCFCNTLFTFHKLHMLVLTNLDLYEAILNFKTADNLVMSGGHRGKYLQPRIEKLQVPLQACDSYWVRIIYKHNITA